ncbi:aminotransferase class V-fold PLP-dependent enzyme [Halobacteriovorax sp. GB3]|uniref:aminotransferase class V-fold PLP-dependent enzyme n=1 Tax=Halobacteriovorax sp. GB3 TaxID=2719615 RepID=UPI00236214C3|nr:aminotransferase class V-fold PLP-dependent enzyme [Halobacteriovorax sp. GB3]MDD0854523.1 aminotransferase class V-fold PLP-dependent enzyme [Halobacteriovorax sp. GB3]
MFQKYYSRFLNQNPDKLHMASHSHHYWPDCTREAMIQYWDDSAKYVDEKWGYIFSQIIPKAQNLIADVLNIENSDLISFAPNTHELDFRLLSALDLRKEIKVLTTDSEYHSFERQIQRLSEWSNIEVVKVPVHPFETFEERFIEKAEENFDFVFFSHVFFNSGLVVKNLEKIVEAHWREDNIVAIDGYHGFMAVPTDLSKLQNKAFYIAGSYKYAQGGEGCCFMVCPQTNLRPLQTGWFAEMDQLDTKEEGQNVTYSKNGLRFAGATIDFSPMYRLISVLELFKKENITVSKIHLYVQKLQKKFYDLLPDEGSISKESLIYQDLDLHGHFLTFQLDSHEEAVSLNKKLKEMGVLVDYRANRIRFGFGIYLKENETFNFLTEVFE